jgi:hypothetical protein
MERKRNKKDIPLFPGYFKLIGSILILLAIVPAIIFISILDVTWSIPAKELFKTYTYDTFILGLFFIAWSRDKVEDELTFAIRLKSLVFAFFSIIFYVILTPLIDFLLQVNDDLTARSVVFIMLVEYLGMYYWQKRGR